MDTSEPPNQNPQPIQPHNFLVIREDYFLHHQSPVCPPTHHEDLPVPPPDVQSSDESDSESEPSQPSSPAAVPELRSRAIGEGIVRWCEIVKAKVVSGISRLGCSGPSLEFSVAPVAAMAAAVLVVSLFWWKMKMRLPWRRGTVAVRRDNEQSLLLLIKDRDEKISQLLLQIAQMNETLFARRRVPVVRIK